MKILKITSAVLIVTLVCLVVLFWLLQRPTFSTLAQQTLCNGTVEIVSTKYSGSGEAPPSDRVVVFYQKRMIFSLNRTEFDHINYSYTPLPVNTTIPTVSIEQPTLTSDGVVSFPALTVFVDPSQTSRADFDATATCLVANKNIFNDILSKTPAYAPLENNREGVRGSFRLAGLIYGTGSEYSQVTGIEPFPN